MSLVSPSSLPEELSVAHPEGLLEACPWSSDAAMRLFALYLLAVINPRLKHSSMLNYQLVLWPKGVVVRISGLIYVENSGWQSQ